MRHRIYADNPCGGEIIPWLGHFGCERCGKEFDKLEMWRLSVVWAKTSAFTNQLCTWVLPLPEAEGLERVVF